MIYFLYLIFFLLINSTIYSEKGSSFYKNFSQWMDAAYTGDYKTCLKISEYLLTLATNRKIWANDNQTMDVITYLGKMGTEIRVQNPTESYNYALIRVNSVRALEAIGGDYAIICVLRIINAERHVKDELVYTACLKALKKLGNDKNFYTIRAARQIYEHLYEKYSSGSVEGMEAFIECVNELCLSAPYEIVKKYRIIEALKELANEFPYYRIYPQEIRKKAKLAMVNIMINANN